MQVAAWEESGLTHHHDLARACCTVFVVLCRDLVLGHSWDVCLHHASELPCLQAEELVAVVNVLRTSQTLLPPTRRAAIFEARSKLRDGGFCVDALGAALHFAVLAESFEEAIAAAKKFAGADNYCPVLVGALLGARFGAEEVVANKKSRSHSEDKYAALMDQVQTVSKELARSWSWSGSAA
mmetsp:Transcript_153562/g.490978  ORF Transcript_153562/g.490978 Transcript_153562/m.490978 type:complete len:182 (-) Transcript_153562:202-747(-)